MKLKGKKAIVTGASSGIGRNIAIELAKVGADVGIGDLQREPNHPNETEPTVERVRDLGRRSFFRETDVGDGTDAKALVDTTVEEFGGLDILVNNAGMSSGGSVEEVSPEDWQRVFDVNVNGIFNVSRYALPHICESETGRIVNIASQLGLVGQEGYAAYCASKGAVVNLTRQMAIDYGDDDVTVNAICPGFVRTSRTEGRLEDEAYADRYDRYNVLPRLGRPEDIGPAAVFVASDDAGYMTGHCLVIDGGYSIH